MNKREVVIARYIGVSLISSVFGLMVFGYGLIATEDYVYRNLAVEMDRYIEGTGAQLRLRGISYIITRSTREPEIRSFFTVVSTSIPYHGGMVRIKK